jgi:hypothetical protein
MFAEPLSSRPLRGSGDSLLQAEADAASAGSGGYLAGAGGPPAGTTPDGNAAAAAAAAVAAGMHHSFMAASPQEGACSTSMQLHTPMTGEPAWPRGCEEHGFEQPNRLLVPAGGEGGPQTGQVHLCTLKPISPTHPSAQPPGRPLCTNGHARGPCARPPPPPPKQASPPLAFCRAAATPCLGSPPPSHAATPPHTRPPAPAPPPPTPRRCAPLWAPCWMALTWRRCRAAWPTWHCRWVCSLVGGWWWRRLRCLLGGGGGGARWRRRGLQGRGAGVVAVTALSVRMLREGAGALALHLSRGV